MKKIVKLLSLSFLSVALVACSCKKEDTVNVSLTNSTNIVEGSKVSSKLTTKDVYDYIRANSISNTNKAFLTYLMEDILAMKTNSANKATYNLKVKNHFIDTYLNSNDYKVNGEFNEDLLASTLESKLYVIDRVNLPTSGPTVEAGLKYDYSDYINRGLKYDVYLQMLKGKYILEEKAAMFDNSRSRIISIFSTDDLEEMETIVEDIFKNKYSSLEALAESKKAEEREEIGRQYCENLGFENEYYEGTCNASTSSSTYDSALYKFTVCENNVRCAPSDGFAYQIKLINEKEYVKEQTVNKNTTGILYPEALSQLFRENVEDYLHAGITGEDPFLADWLYNYNEEFSNRDIILTTGPNSTAYLVTVRVVDSETESIEDKEAALSLLNDKVGDSAVLLHYLENLDVEITDPQLKSYFNDLIGKK